MHNKIKISETGSILITILVMLVFMSLGAGVLLMFSSSNTQVAEHSIELRATKLAEAGIRYAAGQYRSAGNLSAKFDRLEALHEEQVTLKDNNGSFRLKVNPYWFVSSADYTNATNVTLKVLGKFPPGFQAALPTSGIIKINNDFYTYSGGNVTLGTGLASDQFAITLNKGVTISQNTSVYLSFAPPSTQTVSENGSITIAASNSLKDIFPTRNGMFEIYKDEKDLAGTYRYNERTQGSVVLSGITPIKDGALPLTITSSSRIVMEKQVLIYSDGDLGSGIVSSNQGVGFNIYLTEEVFIPANDPAPLDLGGSGPGKQDDFNDEKKGITQLTNWEFTPNKKIPEKDLQTITTQEVETEFGKKWDSSNYVTFQNFSEVSQSSGYVAELVSKDDIDDAGENKDLYGIWGNASDNIFVTGADGTILHYDGKDHNGVKWVKMTSNSSKTLRAIWGTPSISSSSNPDKIVAVGNSGEILEYENGAWKRMVSPYNLWNFPVGSNYSVFDLYGVHGTSWSNITTYGDYGSSPYKWSGNQTWQRYWGQVPPTSKSSYYWKYYGWNSGVMWRPYDYSGWMYRMFQSNWETKSGYNTHIFSVGYDRSKKNNQGFVFKEQPNNNSYYKTFSSIKSINGIWGSSINNIYVVGDKGKIVRSTNGTKSNSWKSIASPTNKNLNGIYGASDDYIYAAGDDGTILYYGGAAYKDKWQEVPSITSQKLNSVWGSDMTGIYAVGDNGTIIFLGYPSKPIGGLVLPLSKNKELAKEWSSTSKYLSYSIQVKTVWGDDLDYGVSGICFRWHQPISGKYAGYGVSFIRYDSSLNSYNDMIPDGIKPEYKGVSEKNDKLLLVLWEQYLSGGAEQRRWLAYKDVTLDTKVVKSSNKTPRDLSSLFVRVDEKRIDDVKVNDINIYYGNASDSNQSPDNKYNNTTRNEYNPTFGPTGSNTIKWPVFDLDDWTKCPNGPNLITCNEADSFTLADNVSVAANTVPGDSATKYWIINPLADMTIANNSFSIRTSRFTSPDGSSFGTQSDRSEIGLHVFGAIGEYGTQELVSFADFAVQLGVKSDGVNSESSFGNL
ncbi:MAG: hypothetical protein H8D87_09085 [Deltaproteobacteria bacterium]|uniref:WD40/YVTN/BNR-like repeat-containing protein n=1 Tax=Desulfobacula sp. TaxID=2593537 RepID=UPI0019B106A0|nr:hypothetical protein [Candidatus Desulfobacula maris]MBL6994286.1 hypothetical protein [Desulfobacula sp.]